VRRQLNIDVHTSQEGIDLIIAGFRGRPFVHLHFGTPHFRPCQCQLAAYRNQNGEWAIGYNHTADVYAGMITTFAQAETWLYDDLRPVEEAVESMVRVSLRQNEFDALVAFAYGLGIDALRHADLLVFLNAQQYDRAADAFLKHGDGPRRAAERALFIAPSERGMWRNFLAWLRG